jgi:hypothetical protein
MTDSRGAWRAAPLRPGLCVVKLGRFPLRWGTGRQFSPYPATCRSDAGKFKDDSAVVLCCGMHQTRDKPAWQPVIKLPGMRKHVQGGGDFISRGVGAKGSRVTHGFVDGRMGFEPPPVLEAPSRPRRAGGRAPSIRFDHAPIGLDHRHIRFHHHRVVDHVQEYTRGRDLVSLLVSLFPWETRVLGGDQLLAKILKTLRARPHNTPVHCLLISRL